MSKKDPENAETTAVDMDELNQDEKNGVIRLHEDDILAGIMDAANYKDDPEDVKTIQIIRERNKQKVCLLEFGIHPLGEEDFLRCRKQNTKFIKNRQLGTRLADEINAARYRSQLIYEATIESDQEKIWNNKEAWKRFNVVTGVDMVDIILKAGEKDAIIEKLEDISGYGADLDETVKNS